MATNNQRRIKAVLIAKMSLKLRLSRKVIGSVCPKILAHCIKAYVPRAVAKMWGILRGMATNNQRRIKTVTPNPLREPENKRKILSVVMSTAIAARCPFLF